MRRRYREAAKLRAAGKLGGDWATSEKLDIDLNFALSLEDVEMMMGPFRFRVLKEEYEREQRAICDALAVERARERQHPQ